MSAVRDLVSLFRKFAEEHQDAARHLSDKWGEGHNQRASVWESAAERLEAAIKKDHPINVIRRKATDECPYTAEEVGFWIESACDELGISYPGKAVRIRAASLNMEED